MSTLSYLLLLLPSVYCSSCFGNNCPNPKHNQCCTSISSYRFMDMFPDTSLIREIQQELDNIIQEGVRNITRLIRATDTSVSDTLQLQSCKQDQTDPSSRSNYLSAKTSRGQRVQRGTGTTIESSLTGRLVRDGLLTPDMIRQLQREWSKEQDVTDSSAFNTNSYKNIDKGKRKKK